MRPASTGLLAALLAGLLVLGTGCSSANINPPHATAHKGYVDLYSPGQTNLFWSVKEWRPGTSAYTTVFSQLKPLSDGVLRLELAPGPQRLQLTFLNRVIQEPLSLQVQVQEGMVTPVKVELMPVAETAVLSKKQEVGPNVSGAGRKTRYAREAGTVERLVTSVQPPVPYRPKEQMSYPP